MESIGDVTKDEITNILNAFKDNIKNMEHDMNRLKKQIKTMSRNTYELQTEFADFKGDIKSIKD